MWAFIILNCVILFRDVSCSSLLKMIVLLVLLDSGSKDSKALRTGLFVRTTTLEILSTYPTFNNNIFYKIHVIE